MINRHNFIKFLKAMPGVFVFNFSKILCYLNNNINKIITTKYYRCNGSNPVLKIPMEANHCCIAVFGYTYSGEGTADTAFLGLLSISWGGKLKYNSLFGQNFENITYNSSDKIIEITFSGHYVTACAINFWG